MNKSNSLAIFEEKQVRRIWDEKAEKWYFSITDVGEKIWIYLIIR